VGDQRRGENVESADQRHDEPRHGRSGLAELIGVRRAGGVRANAERAERGAEADAVEERLPMRDPGSRRPGAVRDVVDPRDHLLDVVRPPNRRRGRC